LQSNHVVILRPAVCAGRRTSVLAGWMAGHLEPTVLHALSRSRISTTPLWHL